MRRWRGSIRGCCRRDLASDAVVAAAGTSHPKRDCRLVERTSGQLLQVPGWRQVLASHADGCGWIGDDGDSLPAVASTADGWDPGVLSPGPAGAAGVCDPCCRGCAGADAGTRAIERAMRIKMCDGVLNLLSTKRSRFKIFSHNESSEAIRAESKDE